MNREGIRRVLVDNLGNVLVPASKALLHLAIQTIERSPYGMPWGALATAQGESVARWTKVKEADPLGEHIRLDVVDELRACQEVIQAAYLAMEEYERTTSPPTARS